MNRNSLHGTFAGSQATTAITVSCSQVALATKTCHIATLPSEILCTIFQAALDAGQPPSLLLAICKDWKATAAETPSLWSIISIRERRDFSCWKFPYPQNAVQYCRTAKGLEILLTMAKNVLLELRIEMMPAPEMWAMIWDIFPRCHTIHINPLVPSDYVGGPFPPFPAKVCPLQLPHLRYFTSMGGDYQGPSFPQSMLRSMETTSFALEKVRYHGSPVDPGAYPRVWSRVRWLSFYSSAFDDVSLNYHKLLQVVLENCRFPSITQSMHALGISQYSFDSLSFSTLDALSLCRCIVDDVPVTIQLPALTHLAIIEMQWTIIGKFETPKLSALTLEDDQSIDFDTTLATIGLRPGLAQITNLRFVAPFANWKEMGALLVFLRAFPALTVLILELSSRKPLDEGFFTWFSGPDVPLPALRILELSWVGGSADWPKKADIRAYAKTWVTQTAIEVLRWDGVDLVKEAREMPSPSLLTLL